MKLFKLGLVLFLFLFSSSCSDDEDITSNITIELDGDSEFLTQRFATGDWKIERVENRDGNQRIVGDIYDEQGDLVSENSPLELDGLGVLDANWGDKGFKLTRKTDLELEIEVYENTTGEEFDFAIILTQGGEKKEIWMSQKNSQGYTLESIEYFLSEGDGDELSLLDAATYRYTITDALETVIYALSGFSGSSRSYFESKDSYAFSSLGGHLPKVRVPADIVDGEIYLSNKEVVYGAVTDESVNMDESKLTIEVPSGHSEFRSQVEWLERQVSYRVKMKSIRTSQIKVVEGKWRLNAPSGNYKVVRVK